MVVVLEQIRAKRGEDKARDTRLNSLSPSLLPSLRVSAPAPPPTPPPRCSFNLFYIYIHFSVHISLSLSLSLSLSPSSCDNRGIMHCRLIYTRLFCAVGGQTDESLMTKCGQVNDIRRANDEVYAEAGTASRDDEALIMMMTTIDVGGGSCCCCRRYVLAFVVPLKVDNLRCLATIYWLSWKLNRQKLDAVCDNSVAQSQSLCESLNESKNIHCMKKFSKMTFRNFK